jgi:ABC-type sugar transport system permease subunit
MAVRTASGSDAVNRGARVGRTRRPMGERLWTARWSYLFMLPGLILTGMFTFYPIVASMYFSLLQWSGFTAQSYFIGLANYAEVIQDRFFWNAFGRSFLFMFTSVPVKLTLALLIALILNDAALRLSPVFRTLFFIPVVTTTAIIGIVMTFILSPFNGPINTSLIFLGIIPRPIDFLGEAGTSLWTVVAVEIWKWLGQPMIYWLAALQTVPRVLYEAAKVDGATAWQQFRHITAPLIKPFAIVIILITAVGTLKVFALVQTMTGGGPYFATEVMEVYIYRTAFGSAAAQTMPRLGYASATAVFFGFTVMGLAVVQWWVARRVNRGGAEMGDMET